MGLFNVRVTLSNLTQTDRRRELDLMVDTGSLFTWVESRALEETGIVPADTSDFHTITGELITRRIGYAMVGWNSRAGPISVVFGEAGDASVLGVTALESLRVTAGPLHKVLVPIVAPAF